MKRSELQRRTPLQARTALQSHTLLKSVTPLRARQKPLQNITGTITTRPRKALRQTRSTNKPTSEESHRMGMVKVLGCICCMLNREIGLMTAYVGSCDAHHLLSGGRRRGHMFTIGVCDWHHEAKPQSYTMGAKLATEKYGPSLAKGSKPFHEVYGTDDELLEFQNALLAGVKRVEADHG